MSPLADFLGGAITNDRQYLNVVFSYSWIFGKRGEVFQLRFIGSFPCRSGYVCAFAGSFERASQVEWSTLKQQIDAGLPLPPPILWAGRILESSTASVYAKLDPQECVEGITITS